MNFLIKAWYRQASWLHLLEPFSECFGFFVKRRRQGFISGHKPVYLSHVPVIVVGNISVGGTGKTPLVIALARHLKAAGFSPGIVSRGYKARPPVTPFAVSADTDVAEAGDEALLMARHTACPVMIAADRTLALKSLLEHSSCDVVLADDGLQHYALGRHIEIAVVDGERGLGNGLLLPAGPLREPPSRLMEVDYVVSNGPCRHELPVPNWIMDIVNPALCNVVKGTARDFPPLKPEKIHAVAGIGNPQRFFNSLSRAGFDIITHAFRDHHRFTPEDLQFNDTLDIIMTEKDAVKCRAFAAEHCWYLKVDAKLPQTFLTEITSRIRHMRTSGQTQTV